jgi:hypothetical protein
MIHFGYVFKGFVEVSLGGEMRPPGVVAECHVIKVACCWLPQPINSSECEREDTPWIGFGEETIDHLF